MNISTLSIRGTEVCLLVFIIATVLPMKLSIASIGIALAAVCALVYFLNNKQKGFIMLFLLALPLLVYVFGLFNTSNLSYGTRFLERSLSFLLFPLLFFFLGKRHTIRTSIIFQGFVLALLVADIYLLYLFTYYFNFGEKYSILVTHDLYHSTYIGFYNLLGITIVYFEKNIFRKSFRYALYIVFFSGIVACSARIVLITGCILILFLLAHNQKKWGLKIMYPSLFLIISFGIVYFSPALSEKFAQFTEIQSLSFNKANYQSLSSRLAKIEAATNLIKEKPFFGSGTGDLIDDLVIKYEQMDFTMGYKYRYNPHNQFLDALARNGIVGGGIVITVLFLWPVWIAYKARNFFLVSAIFVCMAVAVTESIFGLQRGITMFAFIISLLLYKNFRNDYLNKTNG